jgi:hypothetical protein
VTDYSLSIEIDAAGLTTLAASEQLVCLAQDFLFAPDPFVVWLAFPPTQSATITWSDDGVAVYSSNLPVQVGQVIEVGSQLPAVAGGVYRFENGQFSQTGTGGTDSYTIANADSSFPRLTAGIARSAAGAPTIDPDEALPLVAQTVPDAEQGVFQPTEKLAIFAASNLPTSVLVPASVLVPPSPAEIVVSSFLEVDFSQSPSQTVHFDDSANRFELGSLPSRGAADA